MAAGGFCLSASAQSANNSMVKMNRVTTANMQQLLDVKAKKILANSGARLKSVNKATLGGSRWYNYVEHLGLVNSAIFSNSILPYMWFTPDINGIYSQTGGGVVADTIDFVSYAVTFDALDSAQSDFNDLVYSGSIGLTNKEAYTLDSVTAYGVYGRNPAKASIVDTLRMSFIYGNGGATNMPFYYFTGMLADYGVDTVRFGAIWHDPAKNIALKFPNATAPTPAVVVKDVYLNANSVNDTDANGFNKFSVAPNMNIPARNYVGMTLTFKTGDLYTPYVDTAYLATLNSTAPYRFGMFRPLMFEENSNSFPTYKADNWNEGHVKFMPEYQSWDSLYVPAVAYTAPFQYEFPYVDFKISCPTCKNVEQLNVSVKEIEIAQVGNAFPNPAVTEVRIPFTMTSAASVNVTITNTVGATMATKHVGKFAANQAGEATFNIANYANGIYFYTVEANGQRITKRFVVAH